jgi:hypothetical protein
MSSEERLLREIFDEIPTKKELLEFKKLINNAIKYRR